jgi:hypothetical protein
MEVVRSCESIEIGTCTPDYFQEFLTKRLDAKNAVLSAKVRNLDDAQMDVLCNYIRDTCILIRP